MLEIEALSMTFGGVHALSDVSIGIAPGRIYGLIGRGRILWHGKDVSRRPQHWRARAGLARTFQNLTLFQQLSVRENVTWGAIRIHRDEDVGAAVDSALDDFGLGGIYDSPVSVLSLGTRKRVEMARAMVANPQLLLLDEPAAGLTGGEIEDFCTRMRSLTRRGSAVLLVEHDMNLVMSLCEHLYVLDFGMLIAEGTPK